MTQPSVESAGLGWPMTTMEQADAAREAGTVSRETSAEPVGLGWPA